MVRHTCSRVHGLFRSSAGEAIGVDDIARVS